MSAAMSKHEFRKTLKVLNLTYHRLAKLVDVDVRTVKRWASGESPVNTAIALLLDTWRNFPATQFWREYDEDYSDDESGLAPAPTGVT